MASNRDAGLHANPAPTTAETGSDAGIDALSLRCALGLVCALCGFALLIVVAKPALSTVVAGDMTAYLLLILALALGIWGLTWFYMGRLPLDEDTRGREQG